jgi:uncharacterized protein (TIGR02569 family)
MMERGRPPRGVLAAFGTGDTAVLLPGGQGESWRSDGLVLKPVTSVGEAEWTAELLHTLPEAGFQLARPRRSRSGEWVVDGWTACEWVEGDHRYDRWLDALDACRALSDSLASVERPGFLTSRATVWDAGDRAAWSVSDPVVRHPEMDALVSAFSALRRPCRDTGQVIHGDLTGNILYPDTGDPVVLDFAVYWRPAAFAEAIIVADALAYHDADATLASQISSQPRSMLARASIYRLITSDTYASRSPVNDTYLPQQISAFARVLGVCQRLPDGG